MRVKPLSALATCQETVISVALGNASSPSPMFLPLDLHEVLNTGKVLRGNDAVKNLNPDDIVRRSLNLSSVTLAAVWPRHVATG
jgi:hypothetical protein